MSETANASTNVSSASTTTQAPGASAQQGNNSPNPAAAGAIQGNPAHGTQASADDGFEEVTLGSVKGKVPKEIAAALKNLERGFHSKAKEAANAGKLAQLAKENPEAFFQQTGKDPYEFAEALLAKKYELMQKTPEQRRLHELEQQEEQRKNQETASRNEIIDAIRADFGFVPPGAENATKDQLINYYRRMEHSTNQTKVALDTEIGEAFKSSGLPKSKQLLAKVAFEMSSALKRKSSLTAADAVAKVSKEYFEGAKETFGTMDVQRIREIFGDEFLDKIRKYDLDQVTGNAALRLGQNNQGHVNTSSQTEKPKVQMNELQWRKHMGLS